MTAANARGAAIQTAIASAVALMFSAAPAIIYTASIYLKPMQASLGLSRGELSTCFSAFALAVAVGSPLVGWAVDRFGPITVARIGIAGLGSALLGVALFASGFPSLMLLLALAGVFGSAQAPTPYAKLLSGWFSEDRGKALASAMTGIGLGSIVLPFATSLLVGHLGWRTAMAAVAMVILACAGGASFWLREPPAEKTVAASKEPNTRGGYPIWRDPPFWSLAACFALFGAAANAAVGHMVAILDDAHAGVGVSSLVLPLIGGCSVLGRLAAGALLDRSRPERVGATLFVSAAAAILLLAVNPLALAIPAAILLGFAIGAEVDVMAYLVARIYPLRVFGLVYGWQVTLYFVSLAAGSAGLGLVFDRFGRYDVGLYVAALSSLLAAGLMLLTIGRKLLNHRNLAGSGSSVPLSAVQSAVSDGE